MGEDLHKTLHQPMANILHFADLHRNPNSAQPPQCPLRKAILTVKDLACSVLDGYSERRATGTQEGVEQMKKGIFRKLIPPALVIAALIGGSRVWSQGAPPPRPGGSDQAVELLVGQALSHNPGIAAQKQLVLAAEQRPSQARALPDPSADLEFMSIPVNHPSGSDALTKGISLGITQMLPYPGKLKLRKDRAELEVEVSRARLAAMESELRGDVVAAAYRYSLFNRLLAINDQTRDALAAAASSAAGVYASGSGSQADVLLAQTALTKNRTERKDLEQQLEITAARLSDLLGGSIDREVLEQINLPEPSPLPQFAGLISGIDDRAPRILIAQADVSVEDKGVELAKKDFKPDFMVGGRYRYRDMTMGGKDYLTAMVGISLPFFHYKSRYEPALQETMLRRESARQQTDSVHNEVLYQVTDAYQSGLRDQQVYDLYKNGLLIQAQQAYESSLASYTVGKADFTTLLTALTNFYTYEGQADMAKAGFQESVARMEAFLGMTLYQHPQSSPTRDLSPDSDKEKK